MSSASSMPPEVLAALERGAIVVTANQRAARTLRQAYHQVRRSQGSSGWQPPLVLAWDTWLGALWRRLLAGGHSSAMLLNAHQEHALWRDILQRDAELRGSLRSLESLAELAASGWALLHQFTTRRELSRYVGGMDTQAFARWVTEFERRCARGGFLSAARLPEVLANSFANGLLGTESGAGVLLLGFDRKTPSQQALLAAVRGAGITVDELAKIPGEPAGAAQHSGDLVSAGDEQAELEGCARWVRQFLDERPDARVAVIVPNLGELRGRVDRTFREILAPELQDIAASVASAPYEFSLGPTLASSALIGSALDLLTWATGPLPLENISRLLLSPYVAGGFEYVARGEFDAFAMRTQKSITPEASVQAVLRVAAGSREAARCPALVRSLTAFKLALDRVKPAEGERSYAAWVVVIGQLLEAAGWSGGELEDSVTFQTRRRWARLLDELASLDFEGRVMTYRDALAELRRMAGSTLFAPESRDAPVQVLGPLEAAGSRFDAIWFLRAGDLSWPGPVNMHPLLSPRLQREKGMPGAEAAFETKAARAVATRIAGSAKRVLFSYAREIAETHQRPSAALTGLGLRTVALEDLVAPAPAPVPVLVQRLADEQDLPALPDRVVPGGSRILGLQAACGFRAFAEKRLFAEPLEAPVSGLDARERGELVHWVLERFWNGVGTQEALRALTSAERRERLAVSIGEALHKHKHGATGWSADYLEIERERLLNLLGRWLEKELERSPFRVLSHEEKVEEFGVGPLRMQVRLDRVDVLLADGEPAGEIVLDYKTGSVGVADWKGERPDDPQVPLYALAREPGSLAGVAFGTVRPGKTMGFSGLQAQTGVLPGRQRVVDLEEQVEDWRRVLTRLAEEFSRGEAAAAPKQYPTTCRTCEQRLLCRLDPRTLEPESLEELADPDWTEAEAELA